MTARLAVALIALAAVISCTPRVQQAAPESTREAEFRADPDQPTNDERTLARLVNEYRKANDLAPLPLSRSLSKVARLHARDLARHGFDDECSIHSWSSDGPWTPCCYAPDHRAATCMWNKPRELTDYEGVGYEIGYWFSAGARPNGALDTWTRSGLHDDVLRNRGRWRVRTWRAVGIGIAGNFAVAWFGEEKDPSGNWDGDETGTGKRSDNPVVERSRY